MKNNKIRHDKLKKFLTTYSIHVFVLLFLINIGIYYTIRQYIHASGCMTMTQVQTDNRCLYIFNNQIYQKDSRATPHRGHPCGTDVTSVMPASHLGNRALYLLPNYIANLCPAATATPVPTSTPTPRPTATPTPRPTATSSPRPTTPPATATQAPAAQQHITTPPTQSIAIATPAFTATPTNIPTQAITDPVLIMFVNCYGINISSPNCTNAQEVDFNHDGVIDGTDYNLYLLYKVNPSLTIALTPTLAIPSLPVSTTVTPVPLQSVTSPITPQITIAPTTNQPERSVTPVPASFVAAITNKVFLTKLLDVFGIIFLVSVVLFGIVRSRLLKKVVKPLPVPAKPTPSTSVVPVKTIIPDEPVDNTYFVSVLQSDPNGKGIWVQLTGDAGQIEGLYHSHAVPQGFSRVKGTKKTENNKTYIDITEISPAA